MPTVAFFYGMAIQMFFNDHEPLIFMSAMATPRP